MTRREALGWMASVPWVLRGQEGFEGAAKLEAVLETARKNGWKALPVGSIIEKVGLAFAGTPYVGWTLERDPDREFCYVTLTGLDCVTFFESTLAIAWMIKAGETSPEDLLVRVTNTRYRGGRIAGYPSRLHYTADWIYDNDGRGNVSDVTGTLPGAIALNKGIDFMSKHPDVYRQLKAHPELITEIEKAEADLTRLAKDRLKYVPSARIEESKLRTGDVIGIVTTIAGMDCSHTGLIVREGAKARFLHASSSAKKVVLGPSIREYLKGSSKSMGIMVARPI